MSKQQLHAMAQALAKCVIDLIPEDKMKINDKKRNSLDTYAWPGGHPLVYMAWEAKLIGVIVMLALIVIGFFVYAFIAKPWRHL